MKEKVSFQGLEYQAVETKKDWIMQYGMGIDRSRVLSLKRGFIVMWVLVNRVLDDRC